MVIEECLLTMIKLDCFLTTIDERVLPKTGGTTEYGWGHDGTSQDG